MSTLDNCHARFTAVILSAMWNKKCFFGFISAYLITPICFPAVEMRKSLLSRTLNRAFPYLHGMSLEITLTVPLRKKFKVSIFKGVRYDEEKVTLSLDWIQNRQDCKMESKTLFRISIWLLFKRAINVVLKTDSSPF